MLLLVVGCTTLAEEVCEEDGNLINENHCKIGNENSTFLYGFRCGKNIIDIYSNKDVEEVEFPLIFKFKCTYAKIRLESYQ